MAQEQPLECHLLSAVLIFVSRVFVPAPNHSLVSSALNSACKIPLDASCGGTGRAGQSGQGGSVGVWQCRSCSSLCSAAAPSWAVLSSQILLPSSFPGPFGKCFKQCGHTSSAQPLGSSITRNSEHSFGSESPCPKPAQSPSRAQLAAPVMSWGQHKGRSCSLERPLQCTSARRILTDVLRTPEQCGLFHYQSLGQFRLFLSQLWI